MKKQQILCSTGALIGRPNGRDYRLLEKFVPELECDGIEFMLYSTWYPVIDELIAFLRACHFNIPVMHCQKTLCEKLAGMETVFKDGVYLDRVFDRAEDEEVYRQGLKEFEANLRVAEAVGAHAMVLHLWNGPVSDKNINSNYERFAELLRMARDYGVELMPENVICNTRDPLTNIEELHSRYPEVRFVYDTKMAEFHGQTMKLFEPEHAGLAETGRIGHIHMNDYSGGYMDWSNLKVLPIGAGHVDFDTFMQKLSAGGYDGHFTLEATGFDSTGAVDFDMLNSNIRAMRGLLERYPSAACERG